MPGRLTPSALCRRLWRGAILAAALALGLLPGGVMPVPGPQGGLVLVLCSGEGPVSLAVDPATGTPLPDRPDRPDRCLWSLAQAPALLPAAAGLPAPVPRPAGRQPPAPALPAPPPAPPAAPLPRGPPPSA